MTEQHGGEWTMSGKRRKSSIRVSPRRDRVFQAKKRREVLQMEDRSVCLEKAIFFSSHRYAKDQRWVEFWTHPERKTQTDKLKRAGAEGLPNKIQGAHAQTLHGTYIQIIWYYLKFNFNWHPFLFAKSVNPESRQLFFFLMFCFSLLRNY